MSPTELKPQSGALNESMFRVCSTFIKSLAVLGVMAGSVLPLHAQEMPAAEPIPNLFVVGDSTARNNAGGAQGWGDPFGAYWDSAKIKVHNRAMAGRSSRTFITEGRWESVLKDMKTGDFVLIQLGHNDSGPIDTGRARASLPGIGEETREITKADGSKETVHTYGWYMRKMISDASAKGAIPILLSLTVRNIWKNGQVERGSGNYRQLIADLAKEKKVTFVDVTSIIAEEYDGLGQEATKPMFGPDYVHTSPAGAELNATCVVAGLKAIPESPLAEYLSEKGKEVPAAGADKVVSAETVYETPPETNETPEME